MPADAASMTGPSASPDPLPTRRLRLAPLALLALLGAVAACSDGPGHPMVPDVDPETTPTMVTHRVETLISDSGITRYRITSPLWLVYDEASTPHWRFPKGLRLDKYNLLFQREATVTSDSAHYDRNRQVWRLDGNVTIENTRNEVFLTPQLFWDQRERRVYSDSFIHIERADRTIEGYGFTANENMTSYTIRRVQGIFPASQFDKRRGGVAPTPADSL